MSVSSNTTAKHDLATLLKELSPEHRAGEFVFCTVSKENWENKSLIVHKHLIASFQETEGWTAVLPRKIAEQSSAVLNFDNDAILGCITLTVHSSIMAVGLTAAVSKALTDKGISANVIAAFYHDHIFVPIDRVTDAMNALRQLSSYE